MGGVVVKGNLSLAGVVADGGVRVNRAQIGGDLDCENAIFRTDRGKDPGSFKGRSMEVHGSFIWQHLKEAPDGIIDLSGAKVGQLQDDCGSYAKDRLLVIDNFVYESFYLPLGRNREREHAMDTKQRLSWLRSQKRFSPEPYEQAIRVLRKLGHEKEARLIAQKKQRDLRKRGTLGVWSWMWNGFLGLATGHGYKPWLALVWIALFIVVGWAVVFKFNKKDFIPSKEGVYLRPEYIEHRKVPKGYPVLNTLLYSADVFLPIVNFQQKDYWMPCRGSVAGWYLPIHIVLGWFFTALLVAGVSGLIRKD